MNKHNAKDYLPLVQALAEGKTIQVTSTLTGEYGDITEFNWSKHPSCYRIKPKPKPPIYRPWRAEEVPTGIALIRWRSTAEHNYLLVSNYMDECRCGVYKRDGVKTYDYAFMLKFCEHSLDQGKTWSPCGILVTEEVGDKTI